MVNPAPGDHAKRAAHNSPPPWAADAAQTQSVPSTYVTEAAALLDQALPGLDPLLRDLYLLLVLNGGEVTNQHVHNAWAVWKTRRVGTHPDLLPYDQLAPDRAALDQPFTDTIKVLGASRGL